MLVYTGADSLRFYLSGASSDGGTQADVDGSRGRFRSGTEASFLAVGGGTGIVGLSLNYVAGANGPGTGTIEAVDGGSVRWSPPGQVAGPAVAIANGETRVLTGENRGQYVRVSRTSAGALTGEAVVELLDSYGTAAACGRVTSAQAAAGVVVYRLIVLRNEHAGVGVSLRDLRFWVEAAPPGGGRSDFLTRLGASGAGSIVLAGSNFAGWGPRGWALVTAADGAPREVVYYSSRTGTTLTVPAAGRGLCGTTEQAMLASDVVVPWSGVAFAVEEPASQPAGVFGGWDGSAFVAPSGLTWRLAGAAAPYIHRDLGHGEIVGLWLRWDVPAGAAATPSLAVHAVGVGMDTVVE
jgi:hypothetical protein